MSKLITYLFTIIVLSSQLFACGGGGGGGGEGGGTNPANAVADAGVDQDAQPGDTVSLDGTGSSDPDSEALTYTWTQVGGVDVTGGAGSLTGVAPNFTLPADFIGSVIFQLSVNDGNGDSSPDTVQINSFKDLINAFFVDGDSGDDTTGDGSRANPFASISHALRQVGVNQEDIYVRTLASAASYDETGFTLGVGDGVNLYGGYGANWERDVSSNRTSVQTNEYGMYYSTLNADVELSGFEITTNIQSLVINSNTIAVHSGTGGGTLTVRNNTLTTADATGVSTESRSLSSYGIFARHNGGLRVLNNTITTSAGQNGVSGNDGSGGVSGENASGFQGGIGDTLALNGYDGGTSGASPVGGGPLGGAEGTSGFFGCTVGDNGGDGAAGNNGTQSASSSSGAGGTRFMEQTMFMGENGVSGTNGEPGEPGSGGGRGGTRGIIGSAGVGGGGGAAGSPGTGGLQGFGGGSSIGIYLHAGFTSTPLIEGNTITVGNGGNGGHGGHSGAGSLGGDGAPGSVDILGNGCDGGNGGNGGAGGAGGDASGAGGGPSYGIMVSTNQDAIITNNTITAGIGGNGGTSRNSVGGNGGWAYAIYDFDPTDGVVPTLNGNNLTAGTGGAGGITTGAGTAGVTGNSGRQNF